MPAEPDETSQLGTLLKRGWPLLIIVAGIALVFSLGLHRYLSFSVLRDNRADLVAWVAAAGPLAVLAFIGGELQRHMGGFRHTFRPRAHQNSQPSLTQNGMQDFRAVFAKGGRVIHPGLLQTWIAVSLTWFWGKVVCLMN